VTATHLLQRAACYHEPVLSGRLAAIHGDDRPRVRKYFSGGVCGLPCSSRTTVSALDYRRPPESCFYSIGSVSRSIRFDRFSTLASGTHSFGAIPTCQPASNPNVFFWVYIVCFSCVLSKATGSLFVDKDGLQMYTLVSCRVVSHSGGTRIIPLRYGH
jgi:hypothetical protein